MADRSILTVDLRDRRSQRLVLVGVGVATETLCHGLEPDPQLGGFDGDRRTAILGLVDGAGELVVATLHLPHPSAGRTDPRSELLLTVAQSVEVDFERLQCLPRRGIDDIEADDGSRVHRVGRFVLDGIADGTEASLDHGPPLENRPERGRGLVPSGTGRLLLVDDLFPAPNQRFPGALTLCLFAFQRGEPLDQAVPLLGPTGTTLDEGAATFVQSLALLLDGAESPVDAAGKPLASK